MPTANGSRRASIAFVGGYNTKLIAAADAPKRYEDLADPQWKGRLAVEASDANWLMQLAAIMGEDKAIKLFRDIVARNGMSVRRGHSLLANLVPTGEVPLALTLYGYRVEQLKQEGAPVEILYLPPVIGLPTGTGIVRRAPHPHAAALLADFFLTDGQRDPGRPLQRSGQSENPADAGQPRAHRRREIPGRGRALDQALCVDLHREMTADVHGRLKASDEAQAQRSWRRSPMCTGS